MGPRCRPFRRDTPARPVSLGRCGPEDQLSRFDRQSAGDSWVGTTQTVEVWVLPPEAPSNHQTLLSEIPGIAARTGVRDGAWAVGVYDRRR